MYPGTGHRDEGHQSRINAGRGSQNQRLFREFNRKSKKTSLPICGFLAKFHHPYKDDLEPLVGRLHATAGCQLELISLEMEPEGARI